MGIKFSPSTIKVLKNFAHINNAIYFDEKDVIKITNLTKDIIGIYDTDESIDQEHGFFNLAEFISIISLSQDCDIDYKKDYCVITLNGKNKVRYYYSDKDTFPVLPKESDRYKNIPGDEIASFTLTQDDIDGVLKVAKVLQLDNAIAIKLKNGKGTIEVTKEDDKNTIEMDIKGKGTATVKIPLKHFDIVSGDYDVSVTENFIKLKHKEMSLLYILTVIVEV